MAIHVGVLLRAGLYRRTVMTYAAVFLVPLHRGIANIITIII